MNNNYFKSLKFRQLSEIIIWVPAIISMFLYWYTTAQGVGLSPDSVSYVGVADSLLQGKGLVVPFGFPPFTRLTQFPPLYSLLIAFLSLPGFSLVVSARILNFFILLSFYLVANRLLKQISSNFLLVRVLILTLIAVSATFLTITSMVWSETLMITLGLLGFSLLISNNERNNNLITLVTGLIFAFAILARYAAVTFLAAAILYKLFTYRNNLKQKMYQVIFLAMPGFILLSLWLFINSSTTGTATNRSFNFHMLSVSNLRELLTTISGWFLIPDSASIILKLILFFIITLVFFGLFGAEIKQFEMKSTLSPTILLMVFIIVYTFFIIFSILFIDANIPLDSRILSPLFISAIFLTLPLAQRLYTLNNRSFFFQIITPLILFLMSIISININMEAIQFIHFNGTGFNQLYRQDAEIFTYLKEQPQTKIFVSNAPEPAYFFSNHPVYSLPKNYLQMEQTENPEYEIQMAALKNQLSDLDGLFIFFTGIPGSSKTEIDYICHYFGLEKVDTYSEAIIYESNHLNDNLSCKN